MMLVISTQVYENYAAHDWDGTGICPVHWKAKGGHEYKITNIPLNIDYQEVVSMTNIERNDNYFQENILSWTIESDDYLSWFEKSQLEYEGEVVCKEPSVDYSDLNGAFV